METRPGGLEQVPVRAGRSSKFELAHDARLQASGRGEARVLLRQSNGDPRMRLSWRTTSRGERVYVNCFESPALEVLRDMR